MTPFADVLPFKLPERPVVSKVRHREVTAMLHPTGGRTQPLSGFGDEFTDIIDWIYRITHRIWVERGIGLIEDWYAKVCLVYTPLNVTHTVEDVLISTAAMMNAFPDRESHFLNVAWTGDDHEGFYTSHLGFSRMTNMGETVYGPATGQTVVIRTVADCISLNDQIHTEWLIRDNGAMVRQLGYDRHEVARRLAERPPVDIPILSASMDPADQPRDTVEGFMRQMFHDLWNRRRLDALDTLYAPDAVAHSGGGRIAVGVRNISALMISILTSIPDAKMWVEHVSWSEETDGVIVAARWILKGTTRTGGMLGDAPSGREVAMMGISHFRFGASGRIVEEWTLFDEVAVLAHAYRSPNLAEV